MKRFVATSFATLLAVFTVAPSAFSQVRELRTIPVVAMTQDGRVVQGLTARNLRVKGVKATIESVTFDAGPRRVILLLDISGSMGDPGDYHDRKKWDYAKDMAKAFLRNSSAQDLCALDVFAEKEKEIVPLTHDFASVLAAIDALPTPGSKRTKATYGGMTYAGDALNAVLRNAGQQLELGDSVIFFSDEEFEQLGIDTGKRSLDSLRAQIARRGVRVFLARPVVWGLPVEPDFHELSGINASVTFMRATGGFSFGPIEARELKWETQAYLSNPLQKRMAALNNAVQGTYRMELQLDQPLRKKRNLQLELVEANGKTVKSVSLFYPRTLYPNSSKAN